ncbi:HEAT repeat domain-containing protein [Kamptonema cortianum]|nr:HEAT repeat domain-containing protein [Kamptonema cortianum]MDL5049731.1 HEAT repeat domain-containing protein [Oscillatoria amoena NRMC-F 0135]
MKSSHSVFPVAVICLIALLAFGGCSSKMERETLSRTDILIQDKNYSEALALLYDALEKDADNLRLRRQVVMVYLHAGQPATAYRAYRKLLEKPRKKGQAGDPEYRDRDPVLVDALKHPDAVVRITAAKTLSSVKDTTSVKPLIGLLKDSDRDVRRAAANALGELREKSAVKPLIELLADDSWFVRGEAAQSLGKIAEPSAAEPLMKLLGDPDAYVRENAAISIRLVSTESNRGIFEKALNSPDALTKLTAARALAQFKSEPAEVVLIGATTDENPQFRRMAVDSLAEMNSEKGLVRIREMAQKDPDLEVRYLAILAIGLYGDKGSAPLLEEIIKNQNNPPDIRRAAFMAYRKIAEKHPELIRGE